MVVTYGKGFEVCKPLTMPEKVRRLEAEMMALPQVELQVRHFFAPGMYAREITIPKGIALIGVVHKTENLVVLSAGRLRLVTETGTVEISAPYSMTCKAGAKNAAVALEDAVWTNFFPNPTNERDTDKLVEILTESKASDLIGGATNLQRIANQAAERIEA